MVVLLSEIDGVVLNFSQHNLWILNICLGFVMFGVALSLRIDDFKNVVSRPRAVLTGMISQFVLLPALTYLLIIIIRPAHSIALGMLLVASCPGGNISNFMCLMARGNAALSVSLTAISTLLSTLMTPLNFILWSSMLPNENAQATPHIVFGNMALNVAVLLGIPLLLGLLVTHMRPKLAIKIGKPIRQFSLFIFALIIILALAANSTNFKYHIGSVFFLVFIHNALALITGYTSASITRLPEKDRRAISIETGIQNSGLALVLIFDFFNGLGGMAILAAWWGIWHILSGLSLAKIWSVKL